VKRDHIIRCGASASSVSKAKQHSLLSLNLWGNKSNITLKISDISEKMCASLPDAVLDLIEIATYVYCADQAITRGGSGVINYGSDWRRNMQFQVPIRCHDFWTREEVTETLIETLDFLSDDNYSFNFSKLANPPNAATYLDFQSESNEGFKADEVLLFSGGLDSLSGAIQELKGEERRVALVSHRPVPKIYKRQQVLVNELKKITTTKLLHVPVWVNKDESLGKEYTQRSRSFLYACLATGVATLFGLSRIRFYENGVLSFNIPISAQVLGARATRSTHPKALRGFERLFSLVLDKDFLVENPFEWKTKAEISSLLLSNNAGNLIKHSVSCTRTFEATKLHSHCGTCSQCIDRRFGILAANAAVFDPDEMYKVDVLTGPREPGESKTLIESYVRTAREITGMDDAQFFERFPELNRALHHMSGSADDIAGRIFELYKRHAKGVEDVLSEALKAHSLDLLHGNLPDSSILSIVARKDHLKDPWQNYAIELAAILAKGLPIAFPGNSKPKNEKDLQDKAHACLTSAGDKLNKEHPMLQYGVVGTKPDFSKKDCTLFVELKNFSAKSRVSKTVDEIIADSKKYTNLGAHVLFVVYDKKRSVVDDESFISSVEVLPDVLVRIIR